MPKQETSTTNPNANAMNSLLTKIRMEQAEFQLRLANYFVPYGYDPEQADFERMGQLLETHGRDIQTVVFGQASANLQERVAYTVAQITERQDSVEALLAAGAEIGATDEQLFNHARDQVFRTSRAGQQAARSNVG